MSLNLCEFQALADHLLMWEMDCVWWFGPVWLSEEWLGQLFDNRLGIPSLVRVDLGTLVPTTYLAVNAYFVKNPDIT